MNPLPDFMKLWDYQDPKTTEEKFKQLLPGAIASGNINYYHQLLTQVARSQGLQQSFERAHKTLDLVSEAYEDLSAETQVRYLLERGRAFNSSKNVKEAIAFFKKAAKIGSENKLDNYSVDALHMLAIADDGSKERWESEALSIVEKTEDPKAGKWKGSLLNNMGWTQMEKEDFVKAESYFLRARDWFSDNGSDRQNKIARWAVARVWRSLGKFEEALNVHLAEIQKDPAGGDGFSNEEIAENLLALERIQESKSYFDKAYQLLKDDPWLKRDEADRLARLKEMSE